VRYRRVLVPLDGSGLAEDIIPYVLGIADAMHTEVVLIRVVSLTTEQTNGGTGDDMAAQTVAAHQYLSDVAAGFWRQGVRVQTRVRSGRPVTEICAAAREVAADLIAMSTRARNAFGSPSTSVAEGVLRHAKLPVFVMQRTPPGMEPHDSGAVTSGAILAA
jgi:nucleotide-binding universal stress UspA family protein